MIGSPAPAGRDSDSFEEPPPGSPRPPRPFPRIDDAFVLLVFTGLATLFLDIPIWIATPRHSVASFLATSASRLLVMGLVTYAAYRWTRSPAEAVFPLRRFPARFLGAMALLLVGALALAVSLSALLQSVWPKPAGIKIAEDRIFSGEGSLVSAALLVVFLGPVAEELLFRGLILHGFLQNYGRRKAVLWSAILFALYHLNPWQIPLAFVLGVVLALWRVRTGSLWPCIGGHIVANAGAFLAKHGGSVRKPPAMPPAVPGPLAIASIGLAALLFLGSGAWLLRRSGDRHR